MAQERRSANVTVRSVSRDDRTIEVIASTDAKDSHGTRIDQSGWELEQFRKNPVITWAHDDRGYTASGGRPVAKAEDIRVDHGELRMTLRFPKKGAFQFADELFELAADGFLNAVSVGFEPLEDEMVQDGSDTIRVFRKQKLLEVAIVTIPSNDDALIQRAKKLNQNEEAIRSRVERLESLAAQIDPEEFAKYKSYFEQKQPVNKLSSRFMVKWYEDRGEKQPADEKEAWERILADKPATLPVQNAVEAPQQVEKPSTTVTLKEFREMCDKLAKSLVGSAVEASRRGVPIKDLGSLLDTLGDNLKSKIST